MNHQPQQFEVTLTTKDFYVFNTLCNSPAQLKHFLGLCAEVLKPGETLTYKALPAAPVAEAA